MKNINNATIATSELIEAFLSNKELLDILNEDNENELVIINNEYKSANNWMPLALKAILCNVKIYINNNEITNIEISKIDNNDEIPFKALYKTLIKKYHDEYHMLMDELGEVDDNVSFEQNVTDVPKLKDDKLEELKELIKRLMAYYIIMNDYNSNLANLNSMNIILNTQLEEKTEIVKVLYESQSLNNGTILRYIRNSHAKINKIKMKINETKEVIILIENKSKEIMSLLKQTESRITYLLNDID